MGVSRGFCFWSIVVFIFLTLSACATVEEPVLVVAEDADKDGVPDLLDVCEYTVMPQPVGEQGCAIFTGVLPGVDFGADSANLGRDARAALDDFIALLKRHPRVVVALDGHTDNRGSGIRNLELSKQRVTAVVRYLVAGGIEPTRLRPYGFGEARPLVSNASADGRKKNRRIEVSVVVSELAGSSSSGQVRRSN